MKAPLRGVGPFMRRGALGMLFFALGTGFGTLGIIRGVQSETHAWIKAFAPYLAAIAWVGIVGGLAMRSVVRTPWKKEGDAP